MRNLSTVDKTSWPYLSQNGSNAQVLDYLNRENLFLVDLTKIAWRMKDRSAFERVTALTIVGDVE